MCLECHKEQKTTDEARIPADIRKCECCGEVRPVLVCCSSLGAVSFAYCKDCLKAGTEPYGVLVGELACIGAQNMSHVASDLHSTIAATLKLHNKTEAQLWVDVAEAIKDFDNMI